MNGQLPIEPEKQLCKRADTDYMISSLVNYQKNHKQNQ